MGIYRMSGASQAQSSCWIDAGHPGLVDAENVVILDGALLDAAGIEEAFSVIDRLVAHASVRAACGRSVMAAAMGPLSHRGWGRTLVSSAPDAADAALFQEAQALIGRGATDLVIASGDHCFAPLAASVNLHVVSHRSKLSRRLRLAATSVTYLPTGSHQTVTPAA